MKPYPKYKDSGIEWLGEVPEGWEVKPLKTQTDFINGAAFKPEKWTDEGTPIIRIENLNGGDNFNYYAEEVDHRYHVYNGDLLFGWSGNRGTSFGPFIWTRDGRYFLNQHIFNLKKIKAHEMWFYWMLKAVTKTIEEEAHGIIGMVHVTKGMLGGMKIPLPPLPEQQSIATFLDQKTDKIDKLIKKNERLIELLKEKRQAIISHAVTKGIPSHPETNPPIPHLLKGDEGGLKMKDSGIEWIGQIPEGWEVKRLKYVCNEYAEYGLNVEAENYQSEGIRFIRTTDLDDYGNLKSEGVYINPVLAQDYILKDGDLLISRSGTIGRTFLFDSNNNEKATFAGYLVRFALDKKETFPKYIFYFTQSHAFFEWIRTQLIETTIGNVNAQKYANLCVTIPTVDHQTTIANFLDQKTAKIDDSIQKIQSQIATLKEYRQALISNVVTGKVRVED